MSMTFMKLVTLEQQSHFQNVVSSFLCSAKLLGNLLTRRPFPLNCIIEKYLKTPFRVLHNNCWKFSLCCTLADLIFCIVGQMSFGFDHFKLFRTYVEKVLQFCLCDQKSVANWFSKNLQVVYIVIL